MNATPERDQHASTMAARELASLQQQAEQVRSVLARLQEEVNKAENALSSTRASELLEANEQLVFAALRAQHDAETAARALKEMTHSAEIDALTKLPNRILLLDRFARAIATAKRHENRMALLFLDLNNFKEINDMLGHSVGDRVLMMTARCLASSVRGSDTVSRHGGDEFLILLTEISQAPDAVVTANKIVAALGAPSRVGEHVLRLTASIGISIYPDDGEDAKTLIERAQATMHHAKKHGIDSVLFYGEEPASKGSVKPLVPESLLRPLTHYELARAEQERRHDQLREANEQLVLAALSAQELQAAAEQAQRRQTRFLAMLAHELRNPLAPIRTAAILLGRLRTDEPLLPRVQAVIERQVQHMSRMLDDLFDVSRINTGKLRLERQVIEMVEIIDAAVEACRPAMDTRLQHFRAQVPSRSLEVQGDPVRLAQILSNLLDNASKYTQDGGEIELSVVVVNDTLVMTVSDSGIGITAEALPTIFDPFVQDAHATGFNGDGLGIGLTVVRELVEAHRGKVVAKSVGTGHGSQFIVTLPLNDHTPPTQDRVTMRRPV